MTMLLTWPEVAMFAIAAGCICFVVWCLFS